MSTEEQLRGDSLRRQLKYSEDYAKANGLTLTTIHDHGKSGFTGANQEFGRLRSFLDLARDRQIEAGSYLLIESFDRLTRQNVSKAVPLLLEIIGCGITVVTLSTGQVYSQDSVNRDPTSLLVALVIMMRAHDESAEKSRRLKRRWEQNRERAREGLPVTARIPAWLSLSKDRSTISLISERADIVCRIFELTRDGMGAFSVARLLNAEGIPAWGAPKRGGKRDSTWYESYVKKLLHGRTVLGEYQPHIVVREEGKATPTRVPDGEPIRGFYPAAISDELYLAAHAAIRSRRGSGGGRKGAGFRNLFTGLIRCGICNAGLRFIDKGPAPKGGTYLQCSAAHLKGCAAPAWRYDVIERELLDALDHIDYDRVLSGDVRATRLSSAKGEREGLEVKMEALRKSIDHMVELVADVDSNSPALVKRIHASESELAAVEARRAELMDEEATLSQVDPEAMRSAMHRTLQEIAESDDETQRASLRRRLAAEVRKTVACVQVREVIELPHDGSIDDSEFDLQISLGYLPESDEVPTSVDDSLRSTSPMPKRQREFVVMYRSGERQIVTADDRGRFKWKRNEKLDQWTDIARLREGEIKRMESIEEKQSGEAG